MHAGSLGLPRDHRHTSPQAKIAHQHHFAQPPFHTIILIADNPDLPRDHLHTSHRVWPAHADHFGQRLFHTKSLPADNQHPEFLHTNT